MDLTTPRANVF